MVDKEKINIRKLVYAFLNLSWLTRIRILKELDLISKKNIDLDTLHIDMIDEIIKKAKKKNKLEALKKKIEESTREK